jgi:hypothetical protein
VSCPTVTVAKAVECRGTPAAGELKAGPATLNSD